MGESTKLVVRGNLMMELIFDAQIYTPEVLVVEELEESVRGAGGFGSTGGFGTVLPPINGV